MAPTEVHSCPGMSRSRLPPRISAREAAAGVADALDPELALRLRCGVRGDAVTHLAPDLDAEESAAFELALERTGTWRALIGLANRMNDRGKARPPTQASKRRGAPARDALRERLRALRKHVSARLPQELQRRATRVVALLVLLSGWDTHKVFWRADDSLAPPSGRARVRWLEKRIGDLVDDGVGQYAARKERRL